jgi:hypothetical protein
MVENLSTQYMESRFDLPHYSRRNIHNLPSKNRDDILGASITILYIKIKQSRYQYMLYFKKIIYEFQKIF